MVMPRGFGLDALGVPGPTDRATFSPSRRKIVCLVLAILVAPLTKAAWPSLAVTSWMLASVFGALRSNTPPPDRISVFGVFGPPVRLSRELSAPSVAMKVLMACRAVTVVG